MRRRLTRLGRELAGAIHQRRVVRDQHAAARRGDDLVAVERVDADPSEGAAGTALVPGTERFCGVFQHRNAIALAKRQQRVHVGALAIQIDDDHAARQPLRPAGPFESTLQRSGRHVPAAGFAIDEDRPRAAIKDGIATADESQRRTKHGVAGLNTQQQQRQVDCRSAGTHSRGVADSDMVGKFAFEAVHMRP